MKFKKKSVLIGEWLKERAGLEIEGMSATRYLASKENLTTQAIYSYAQSCNEGKRDIRVVGDDNSPEIWEVKRLGK